MKKRAYTVDKIFVLVLFAVFAVTVLFVLMSGAGVYKDTQSVMTERYEERTALSYIGAKVNHYDTENAINITKVDSTQALVLNDETSTTYIYCLDGYIKELSVDKDTTPDLSSGLEIIEAKGLEFERVENLIKITCTGTNDTKAFLTLHIASGIGGQDDE